MRTPAEIREAFAVTVCDAWFAACELPQRWPSAPEDQRATFRAMADHAAAAGEAGERSVEGIAQALCAGFWQGHPRPWPWERLSGLKREIFRVCARAVLARADELRRQRQAA